MANLYGPRIVTDGLVLHLDAGNRKSYPGSGNTWYDLSGNGRNGTLNNAVYNSANNAMYFDENGDYVSVSDFSFSNFTICSFVKLNKINDYQGIMGQADTIFSNLSFAFRVLNNNKLNISFSSSGTSTSGYGELNSYLPLTSGVWYYLCASFNKPNLKLYINGIEDNSTSFNADFYNSTSNFIIGGYAYGTGLNYLLNGYIGSTSFYNRALTSDEITQNYNALKGRFGL
jgi:hypothetical protein